MGEDTGERRRPFGRGPFPKKPIDFSPESARPLRPRKKYSQLRPELRPRPPIDNEIPDSANVQNSPAGADEPSPVENNRSETRQAQLNLGGIIALGVFGGFVFLAAIITTIVILIRRSSLGSEVDRENSEVVVHAAASSGYKSDKRHHHRHHHHHKHRSHGGEDRHSRHQRY